MKPRVLALAETRGGLPAGVAHEAVSAASALAASMDGEAAGLVLTTVDAEVEAAVLAEFGASKVILCRHEGFAAYNPEQWTGAVVGAIESTDPEIVVIPATALGKDLAPRVAATMDVPLAGDATRMEWREGSLRVTRPVFSGKAIARIRVDARPAVVTIRPNVFGAVRNPRSSATIEVTPELGPPRTHTIGRKTTQGELDVTEAAVVVSGGRGMKGPENWHLLEALRDALGSTATLGASRAVVDAGWRPHAEQVGQTGKTVTPKLYIAAGISGAIQHLAGMRSAATIVAINRDPDAPIFRIADYGVVGDLFEILPTLADAVAQLKAGD